MSETDLRRQLAEAEETIRVLREELAETSRGLLVLDMELEDRVAERTSQLEAVNAALRAEIVERERAEAERERLLAAEQEARSQAEVAVRMRNEFISVAAHELKTPVTSLRGYAQIIARQFERTGSIDPHRISRAMETIARQSARLNQLIEQLLNLSRLEAGKLRLAPEETDVAALVGEVVATVRLSHPERTIEFRDGQHVCVVADALRIEQVITNLIDNAIKFSPLQSPVEVAVDTAENGWVRIGVRDHGIGIPEDRREHIFERFYQAHAERHSTGMGIGLYISRQITEMHGGTLVLERSDNGGSLFVIRLPLTCGDGPR